MTTEYYYWITAKDPETGKPFLIAGGRTEDECRQKGLELLAGIDFEIKRLPTRSLSKASSLLKGNRLEETKSLHKAAERLGHDRTVRKRIERLRQHRNNL